MEFGKVPIETLGGIDWQLPPDDPVSTLYLNQLKLERNEPLTYFIGAPAWGHKEWVGKIYPLGANSANYLFHYSRNFNAIEFNSTHYRIPTPEQTEKWTALVPQRFLFCPKVFKEISHSRLGMLDAGLLGAWWSFLANLGEHCGPSFLQLPPGFDYSSKALLFRFLQGWPADFELALEFRHPSWFEDRKILPALVEYLQGRGMGLVITDVAGRRDVSHSSVSAPFTMVRFVCNDLHSSDYTRTGMWNERLRGWESEGLRRAYFFVHQPKDIRLPEMAKEVIRVFNEGRQPPVLAPLLEPNELTFGNLSS